LTISLWLFFFAAFPVAALQPIHNFSDKTVAELLSLLESTDARARHCAAIFIGDRYRNPKAMVFNAPIHKPNSPAPELPIPSRVIPALTAHLKTDADWDVRVSALGALRELRFRTNTTPIVALALEDKDRLIRIRACSSLIDISHDYSEPIHTNAIPALIRCLNPIGKVEQIWQAAYAAEQLGTNGTAVVPALRTLTKHDSHKVRHYAERALSRIEAARGK
jgi:HEAT repeat protein